MMDIPFNLIINGPTYSGKTHLPLKILKQGYKGVFDYIVLLCATYNHNDT